MATCEECGVPIPDREVKIVRLYDDNFNLMDRVELCEECQEGAFIAVEDEDDREETEHEQQHQSQMD